MKLTIQSTTSLRLIELIRSALWQTAPDSSIFSDGKTDWEAIGELAVKNTVMPLAIQGALALPHSLLPPREWILKAYSYQQRNRRTHVFVNNCLTEAVSALKKAGLSPVLLKGQAYAQSYPDPALRQCGDIDLYIGKEDYIRAISAADAYGWEKDDSGKAPGHKHIGCKLRNIRVELHRIASRLPIPIAGREFERWSCKQLTACRRNIYIEGTEIPVPSHIFDVIFVFLHLYLHFINGGIGLRQLCDWVLILHSNSANIDKQELLILLKKFRLLRAWQLFGPIAVETLGLPENEFPFYSDSGINKSALILSRIINEGNFGRHSVHHKPRPAGYFRGKLHTITQISRRLVPLLRIDPLMVTGSYINLLSTGLTHFLSDLRTIL